MKAIIRRLYEGHHAIEIQLFKQRCPSRSPRYNLNRPRAPAYQSHNPFPFLKHPGELRNGVYKLVSSSTDWLYCGGPKLPMKGHTEGISCYASLQNIMIYSSLYRTCKERRLQGRVFFHHFHHFVLSVKHGGCLLAILLWLRNIGESSACAGALKTREGSSSSLELQTCSHLR